MNDIKRHTFELTQGIQRANTARTGRKYAFYCWITVLVGLGSLVALGTVASGVDIEPREVSNPWKTA